MRSREDRRSGQSNGREEVAVDKSTQNQQEKGKV